MARLVPVGAFTFAYLLAAVLGAVTQGNLEFVFYIVVMLVLVAVVWTVDRRVHLSLGALWGLSIWGLAHMIGGLVPVPTGWPVAVDGQAVVYSLWLLPERLKYDQVVHAFGFGVTTWVCWQGLSRILRERGAADAPTAGLMVLCGAAGAGFGALNEVIEFAATLLVPETNVGGYLNTGWDLVANLVGVTAAALAIRAGWLPAAPVSRGERRPATLN